MYAFNEIMVFLGDYVVENEKHFLEDLINMHQRKMSCGGGDEAIHQACGFLLFQFYLNFWNEFEWDIYRLKVALILS